jgi:hypothetical protein
MEASGSQQQPERDQQESPEGQERWLRRPRRQVGDRATHHRNFRQIHHHYKGSITPQAQCKLRTLETRAQVLAFSQQAREDPLPN